MTRADIRIDDDFELKVPEGRTFQTLYVRVVGQDSPPNVKIPSDELRRRALRGNVAAQIEWGNRLLDGDGAPKDPEAALRWFKIAAGSGDAVALNMVGRCYEVGWGVRQDPEEAVRWFRLAAEKNFGWAQYNLGKLLARGHAGNRDPKVALSLLVRAARQRVSKGMNMLGRYREAEGRLRSAALWYRWAAHRGCFRGQFHHGRFLVAEGKTSDGIHWLRTSLSHAPQDFRDEALEILGADPAPELRALAAEVGKGERGSAT
jgi:TPR repeat protein